MLSKQFVFSLKNADLLRVCMNYCAYMVNQEDYQAAGCRVLQCALFTTADMTRLQLQNSDKFEYWHVCMRTFVSRLSPFAISGHRSCNNTLLR